MQKQEDILKIKALFFANYLGQECRSFSSITDEYLPPYKVNGTVIENIRNGNYPDAFLQLRSCIQLTDEECVKLATIVIDNPFNRYRRIEVSRNYNITGFPYISVHHKNVKYRFEIDCTHFNFSVYDMGELCGDIDMKPYACIDYLRSIGILLPFTFIAPHGTVTTYSEEELIERGWAKV